MLHNAILIDVNMTPHADVITSPLTLDLCTPTMALNTPTSPTGFSTSVHPSERLRHLQSISGTIDTKDSVELEQSIPVVPVQEVEDELSEQQLRELYDSEEIDRFLNIFSAYVTEVRLPGEPAKRQTNESRVNINEIVARPKEGEAEEGDWIPIHGGSPAPWRLISTAPKSPSKYLSEHIAQRFIVPHLPPASLPQPLFTFGRLRVTTQRVYLSVEPAYKPFFAYQRRLARWENRRQSFVYCSGFWVLWWYNLLLPSLFLRIFYAVVRRKIFPYPTLQELRNRRREVARADVFGDTVQARLTPSSPFGLQELWRIFKVFNKSKEDKGKKLVRDKGKGKTQDRVVVPDENMEGNKPPGQGPEEATTVLDDSEETNQDKDTKRAILETLNNIADLHERIRK